MHRDTPPDYVSRIEAILWCTHYPKRGSNNLAIARKIIATEKRTDLGGPMAQTAAGRPKEIDNGTIIG